MIQPPNPQRYTDWWQGRNEVPLLLLTLWDGAPPPPDAPSDHAHWFDFPSRWARECYNLEHTRYLADGLPSLFLNFGPGVLGACMGGHYHYDRRTFWFTQPALRDLADIETFRIRDDNTWWRVTRDYTDYALDQAAGRYLVSVSDIGGGMDVLAGLYGSQELLIALVEQPEAVMRALDVVYQEWWKLYDALSRRILERQGAMTSWNGVYAHEPSYTLQNDLSCMISPALFRATDLPFLRSLCQRLALPMYHLDGPDATTHLDALLTLENLRAIQWIAGAGAPGGNCNAHPSGMDHWLPLLRRIVDAGLALELYVPPQEVVALAGALGGRGLLFKVQCQSLEQAQALEAHWA